MLRLSRYRSRYHHNSSWMDRELKSQDLGVALRAGSYSPPAVAPEAPPGLRKKGGGSRSRASFRLGHLLGQTGHRADGRRALSASRRPVRQGTDRPRGSNGDATKIATSQVFFRKPTALLRVPRHVDQACCHLDRKSSPPFMREQGSLLATVICAVIIL